MPFAAYLVPPWVLVGMMLLVGSMLIAVPVSRGDSEQPRWMALANPAVLIVVIGGCGCEYDSVVAGTRLLLRVRIWRTWCSAACAAPSRSGS
jgi:hypothetical protein